MNDFIRADISSALSNEDIFNKFSASLPDFSWKMGDSDAQGSYFTGSNLAKVKIQCWTAVDPMAFTLSFRQSILEEKKAQELTEFVITRLIPSVGKIVKINI